MLGLMQDWPLLACKVLEHVPASRAGLIEKPGAPNGVDHA